jgi:hypothetical protein
LSQVKNLSSLVIATLLLSCAQGTHFQLCTLTGCQVPPDSGTPTGCTDDSQCRSPVGRCLVSEQHCVACLTDADCAAGVCDVGRHVCALLPDACGTAQPLALGPTVLEITGDTTRAADDTLLSCALPGTTGRDLVYTFTVDQPGHLVATASAAPGSALQPLLGLRKVCSSLASSDNLACAYGGSNSGSAELTADLQPGPYWLWLDGDGDTSGPFKLDVQLQAISTQASCADPTALVFSGGTADLSGDTRGHTDDSAGLCGGAGASDIVYTFTLSAPQSAHVVVAPSGLYAPVVYVRGTNCTDTTVSAQLWCGGAASGQSVDMVLPRLEAGTYYLFVDGAHATGDSAAGPFHMTVTLGAPVPPPGNDDCQAPQALPVPSNGVGTFIVHGDTTAANNDAMGCDGLGPDVVYSLLLTTPTRVGMRVTPSSGSPLRPSLYLRQPGGCASEYPADELGCAAAAQPGSMANLVIPSLPPGQYFVWVDGVDGTAGAFDLAVELVAAPPPPSNDVCGAAQSISLASGPVTVMGTTVSASDDAFVSCTIPFGGFSPDVVYTIELPTAQALAIDLTAASGSALRPTFGLRVPGACSSVDVLDELACAWDDPQLLSRTVLTLPNVPAGSYSLWVEGDNATQGDFSLRVATSPPVLPPPNDRCGVSMLQALAPGGSATGDTRAAINDDEGNCGFPAEANGENAPDVVFPLTLGSTQSVTVTVTPDPQTGALFRPVVYVRAPGQCSTAVQPLGCQLASDFGQSASVTLPNLAPGTYNVWVDGAGLSSGGFSIRVQ